MWSCWAVENCGRRCTEDSHAYLIDISAQREDGQRRVSFVQSEGERYDSSVKWITEEELTTHLEFMGRFDRSTAIRAVDMVEWVRFAHVDVPLVAVRPTRLSDTGPYLGEYGDRATMLACSELVAAVDRFRVYPYDPASAGATIAQRAKVIWSSEALAEHVLFGTSTLRWEGVLGLVYGMNVSTEEYAKQGGSPCDGRPLIT